MSNLIYFSKILALHDFLLTFWLGNLISTHKAIVQDSLTCLLWNFNYLEC